MGGEPWRQAASSAAQRAGPGEARPKSKALRTAVVSGAGEELPWQFLKASGRVRQTEVAVASLGFTRTCAVITRALSSGKTSPILTLRKFRGRGVGGKVSC